MSEVVVPSLLAVLLERLQAKEALDLELKSARGGLPRSLWPTVSAFANTHGGWIVLGVGEADGTNTVEGVPNPSKLLQELHDLLRNQQKISYPACGADDVSVELVDGKQVIVMRVRAAPRRERPVYINGNPYVGTYVRRYAGDHHCTKPEVDRMMREASDVAADSTILPRFGWQDVDGEAFSRYRRRYQTQNPTSPWNEYDDRRFLEAIGGFGRDRETGAEGLTVAGLLLLGTPESIREWRTRHLIDYRLVSTGDPEQRWDDRIVWEGNIFGAIETILPRLTEGLPVPFRLREGVRVDEGPMQVALREALVNLLVHADYAETRASLIVRAPEGFRFRNPGSSRVSDVDLLLGDQSDPRNPQLVRMFRFVGLAEEAGTGMPRIVSAWRELGFQPPAIDVGTERYEFTLELRHVHMLSEEDRRWLGTLSTAWTEAEQLALVLARHEGSVDNLSLRRLTGQHPADVTKVLGNLRDRRFLRMIGGGRGARYELGPAATLGPLFGLEPVGVNPGGKHPSSGGNAPSTGDTRTTPGGTPTELWGQLDEIAAPLRQRQRLPPAVRDELLVELCGRAPLSLREIVQLTGRNEDHMHDVLRSLINTGRLTYLYPAQPSHPRQRYVAAEAIP